MTAQVFSRNGGTPVPVTYQNEVRNFDLALLKLPDPPTPYWTVAIGTNATTGATVCSGGFPGVQDYTPTTGVIGEDYDRWQTASMAANEGESGAPVFLTNGEVVAVRKGDFANKQNSSVLIRVAVAQTLLSGVPDLKSSCTFIANPPQPPVPPPFPSQGTMRLDGIDFGHISDDLPFACGSRSHSIDLNMTFDRGRVGLAPLTTTCSFASTMQPGNAYIIMGNFQFFPNTASVTVNSCSLINAGQARH
jgi:hypothetical protein